MSPPLPGRKAYSRGAYAAWERRAKGQKDQNIVRGSAVAVRRSSTPPTTRWGRRRSRLTVARIQPGPAIDAPGSAADALCLSWCRGRPCGPGPRPEAASTDLQSQTREMTDPPAFTQKDRDPADSSVSNSQGPARASLDGPGSTVCLSLQLLLPAWPPCP